METFVREAIARAAFERAEIEKVGGGGGGGGWSGGFLEVSSWRRGEIVGCGLMCSLVMQVEDLEKLAPQLILDF